MAEKETKTTDNEIEKEVKNEEPKDKKNEKKTKKSNKTVDTLREQVKELTDKIAERDDMLLRKAAEFDNYKKREAQSKERMAEFVKGNTLKELLPSVDNLERALAADESSADYAKGVSMTVKSLLDALKKMGLQEINPEGQPFDVNEHQAVMQVEDDSVGPNTVVQVLQKGYKLGDTVLRHAMVKVANCE